MSNTNQYFNLYQKANELGVSPESRQATARAHNAGILTAENVRAGKIAHAYEKLVNADLLEFLDNATCACIPNWALMQAHAPRERTTAELVEKAMDPRNPHKFSDMQYLEWKGLIGPGALLKDILEKESAIAAQQG